MKGKEETKVRNTVISAPAATLSFGNQVVDPDALRAEGLSELLGGASESEVRAKAALEKERKMEQAKADKPGYGTGMIGAPERPVPATGRATSSNQQSGRDRRRGRGGGFTRDTALKRRMEEEDPMDPSSYSDAPKVQCNFRTAFTKSF